MNNTEEHLLRETFRTYSVHNHRLIINNIGNIISLFSSASINLTRHSIFCFGFQADVDNSGTIDYGEFIAATLHLNKIDREDHLVAAFSYFDKDGSGYITKDELQKACEEFGLSNVPLEEMIREADQNNVSIFLP
jgi:Ca2+-binding EF-hand superfamily protein